MYVNTDGTVHLVLDGVGIDLKPDFDIEEGADGAHVKPEIRVTEDGLLEFVNENGDVQQFSVQPPS